MTVGHVGTASLTGQLARRVNHGQHQVGDRVSLQVLRRLNDRHYLVSFRDAQRVVNSTVPLTVGSTVRATVTAVGEKLELRYLEADTVATAMADHETANEDQLADFAGRYGVELHEEQRDAIQRALLDATDPTAMASGGVFLSKLSLPVDDASLQAVYAAQLWGRATPGLLAAKDLDELIEDSSGRLQPLAALLDQALDVSVEQADAPSPQSEPVVAAESSLAQEQAAAADTGAGEDDWRRRAQEILNTQDEGSLAYRYGVLPVLIAGELVELDLVHFRERRQDERTADSRRLIMTFKTSTLGRVEILVRALDDRLSVGIKTDSVASRETLAAHSDEVIELLRRLGWNVEFASYEVGAATPRAARHVLDHVLNADTLSRLA